MFYKKKNKGDLWAKTISSNSIYLLDVQHFHKCLQSDQAEASEVWCAQPQTDWQQSGPGGQLHQLITSAVLPNTFQMTHSDPVRKTKIFLSMKG